LVDRVGKNIAEAVALYFTAIEQPQLLAGYSWAFTLVNDDQVNAFCLPGGKIVVYTGILPYTQDEKGLAVVVGHEVGHAIAKHANERLSQQLLVNYGGVGVGALLSKGSSTVQTIGSVVYGLGTEVGVMLPYSRKQEYEADHIGLILMAIAGYDPNAAVAFWQRMSQQKNANVSDFLSTHPSDDKRIAEIKKEIPGAMEYYQAIYGKKPATTNSQWSF
jgi:predicted Zn-dependent protease